MAIKLKVCVAASRLAAVAAALLLLRCCCCRFRLGFASFCRSFACVCVLWIGQFVCLVVVVAVVRRRHLLSATSNRLLHLPPSTRSSPTRISRDSYLFVAFKLFISIALFLYSCASLSLSHLSCFAQFFIVFFMVFYSLSVAFSHL